MYSEKIEKAIRVAGIEHASQYRKGDKKLPYVTHPFSVALIVQQYTDDEDVFVPALLHDTIEDTEYKLESLKIDFGERVHDIVFSVTEPQGNFTWEERKREYIRSLESASSEALLVAAADKIHNFQSIIDEYVGKKERFLVEFSGTIESRAAFYGRVVEAIAERLDNPIVERLKITFKRYKQFLSE